MVLRNIVEGVGLVATETILVAVDSGVDVVVIGIEVLVAMAVMIGGEEVISGAVEEILEVVSMVEDHGVGTIGNSIRKAVKLTGLKNHGVTAKIEEIVTVGLEGAKEILIEENQSIARR